MAAGYVLLQGGPLVGPFEDVGRGESGMRGATGIRELTARFGRPMPNGTMLSIGDRVYEITDEGLRSVASGPAGSGMVGAWTGQYDAVRPGEMR